MRANGVRSLDVSCWHWQGVPASYSGPARLPDFATTAGGSPWFGTAPHNAVSSLARKNAISGRAAVAVILRLFLCQ
jgi:hypothetical protein